jgi:hypothetical protein
VSVPGCLSLAALRQRVAAAVLAAVTHEDGQESTIPWDQFGTGESGSLLHKSYAVGCPSTTFQGRQRGMEGTLAETEVRVRWAFNLAALDQITSYDEALAFGGLVVEASRRIIGGGVSVVILVSASQALDDQGWMNGDVTLRVIHQFSLT